MLAKCKFLHNAWQCDNVLLIGEKFHVLCVICNKLNKYYITVHFLLCCLLCGVHFCHVTPLRRPLNTSVPEKLVLLGYDPASLGSEEIGTLEDEGNTFIRNVRNGLPSDPNHISEKRTPQPNRCEKIKTRKSMPARVFASKPQQEKYARF